MGNGELYNVASDPYELENLFQNPAAAEERNRLVQELLAWTIRTPDDLPVAAYKVKCRSENGTLPIAKAVTPGVKDKRRCCRRAILTAQYRYCDKPALWSTISTDVCEALDQSTGEPHTRAGIRWG